MVLYERSGDDIDRGLIGYWKLDDKKSGSSVAIDRINFNDGAISGSINTTGINGLNSDTLLFDGVDDNVEIDNFIIPSKFSISFWFNLTQIPDSDFERLIDMQDSGPQNGFTFVFGTDAGGDRDVLSFTIRDGATQTCNLKTSTLIDSVWYHISAIFYGTSARLYLNGLLIDSDDSVTIGDPSVNLFLGKRAGGSNYFDGKIQNLRIYNRSLTGSEVSKLYRLRK